MLVSGCTSAPWHPGREGPSSLDLPRQSRVFQGLPRPDIKLFHVPSRKSFLSKLVCFSISWIYLTDSHSSTWVHTLNVCHQPSWYHHLVVTNVFQYTESFCKTDLIKDRHTATHQTCVAALTMRQTFSGWKNSWWGFWGEHGISFWEAPGGRRQDLLTHSGLIKRTPWIFVDEKVL